MTNNAPGPWRAFERLLITPAARDVRLAIEPLNRFETDLVKRVELGLDLCNRIGRDNVGLLLDTFHMNIEEKSLAAAITSAGHRLFHVQAAENDRGTPGSGHVPWDQVFGALDAVGYGGSIVIKSFLPWQRSPGLFRCGDR